MEKVALEAGLDEGEEGREREAGSGGEEEAEEAELAGRGEAVDDLGV